MKKTSIRINDLIYILIKIFQFYDLPFSEGQGFSESSSQTKHSSATNEYTSQESPCFKQSQPPDSTKSTAHWPQSTPFHKIISKRYAKLNVVE